MRETARRVYVWGVYVVAAAVVLQFLLAGLIVFADAGFRVWHTTFNAAVIGLLPLVLVLIGWYGRVPGRLLGWTAAIFGLTVLQSLLLFPYHLDARGLLRLVSGLHVLNALFIFWVALQLVDRTRLWAARPA